MASTNGVPPHGASSSSAAAAASSSTSSAVSRFLDEVLLASSTAEGPVHAWDLKTGMQLRAYKHTACGRGGLTLVGDDYLVAAHVAKCALDVWTLDRESSTHRFFVGEAIGVVAASPCGALFAAGGVDGGVFLWETSTGRLLRSWPAHFKAVSAIAFACDGGVLVTGGEDTVVTTWSVSAALDPARGADEAPASTHSWAEHALPVTGLAIARGAGSGAASLVVSCSADRTCRVWTLGGGHLLRTMRLPCALTSVAIDRCEATVYAGGADGRIFEIPLHASAAIAESLGADDASGGGAAAVLEGHGRAVTSLACSADNERLVSASEDATARVWDVASRQTTHVLRHPKNVPMSCAVLARRERVAGDGAGGGGGGGGGGEKRKLAPLAPFSRFASGGGGGGAGGKLKPWEGAPIALRGVGGDVGGVGVGASSGVVVSWGRGGGGDGEKKKRGRDDAAAEEENEDGDEDAGPDLRRRLADAEKVASAAREETKAWKAKHAELRAFVADELVNRETSK